MDTAEASSVRPERRKSPRVIADAACRGRLKTTIPVTILNLSMDGLLMELKAPLRPGMTYDLSATFPASPVSAMVRITRCRAGGTVEDGRGGRCLLFLAGATFEGLSAAQRGRLQSVVASGHAVEGASPGILRRG